jgi:hypothetical protein
MTTTEDWIVRVVLATEAEVSDAALDKMADAADERDASVARRASGPGVVVTMDFDTTQGGGPEIDWAVKLVCEVGRHDDAVPVDIRFMTLDAYEAEALRPDVPQLASAADAAVALGVSRQRVHQLASSNPDFPQPVARVATGPLWTRSAIDWFDSVWERKAGRPAKLSSVDSPEPKPVTRADEAAGVAHKLAAAAGLRAATTKRSAKDQVERREKPGNRVAPAARTSTSKKPR